MHCPYCENDSQVVDSRVAGDGVRRRRVCNECKRRFTTYERIASPSIRVVKRDGKLESFEFDKLVRVLARVGRGRPSLPERRAERMARTIEAQLIDEGVKKVRSDVLVGRLLEMLEPVDSIAYQRLASDYIDETGQLRTAPREPAHDDAGQLGLFRGDKES